MNRSGRLGSSWETACAEYAASNGFPTAERRVRNGRNDRGDISGVAFTVLECKNTKVIDLPGFLREAEVERENDGAEIGAVLVKRRGKGVKDGYFVVDIETGFRILRTLIGGEPWT